MPSDTDPRQYSLVPDDTGGALLMVERAGRWGLPAHTYTEAWQINAHLRERFGVDVLVRGSLAEFLVDGQAGRIVAHLRRESGPVGTDGVRWVDRAALDVLDLAEPEHRPVLAEWFATAKGEAAGPLDDVAWARIGWYDETIAWAADRLAEHGAEITGPVEQYLGSAWSCHLRVPTSDGEAYVKASIPAFGFEPELTRLIGEWYPRSVVPVLAVDPARRVMLARAVGHHPSVRSTLEHVDVYAGAVARYADIQRRSAGHLAELTRMGLPDWRPAMMPGLLEELLADEAYLFPAGGGGLSVAEHERLLAFLPDFRERCERMSEWDLPDTLVNIDFWRGNLEPVPTGTIIYDWAECAIGHPLISLVTVLRDFELNDFPDGGEVRRRLLDAHLAGWPTDLSPQRLAEGVDLARPLGILARILCWRSCIDVLTDRSRHEQLRLVVANNTRRLLPYAA